MFTGIVEGCGTVERVERRPGGARVVLRHDLDWQGTAIGDSVAVDGVCLTVVALAAGEVSFQLGPETLAVTSLGRLSVGARVHVERALAFGGRLDGHLVLGHVDAVGTVRERREAPDALFLRFDAPDAVLRYCIAKGSVTISGTSLTLNTVDDRGFEVCLIPHTLSVTKLGDLQVGDTVNLEADVIGKYVERLLGPRIAPAPVK
ncbi:MAG: riboflavin synthase [Deltaproteobacteria bacterium]|nr:riboflavin synthase [Deltaproteobacteria bacterium]